MTVRSPQDLGFEVNTSAVDPYAIPGIQLPTQSPTGQTTMGNDTVQVTPDGMEMQPNGTVTFGNRPPNSALK
eukprot:CAMPEP_0204846896 /NCGR_PEP_ID=MMETSP1347-20130617/2337_1 /ASSEMBLY_ACC=CAM_ASM_000690 /TAXON_ID=215587 /ORGANISM="Aplanochytrium stocchinoi, Strain GSBS06" /LENGTH=71 /DNA_ID=CAMNT_0051987647 /DNA_START=939 /DNA_END=1152 /DNA_ORIENTATION=-